MTVQDFVHRVVHNFPKQVVETRCVYTADVHPRPLADGLKAFQNGDRIGVIGIWLIAGRADGHRSIHVFWGATLINPASCIEAS